MDSIVTAVVYINSIVILAVVIILYRLYRTNNYIRAAANKWFGHMGTESGKVRNKQKRERIKLETKGKLVSAIGEEIPFATGVIKRLRKDGMSDDDLFTMITDPEVVDGILVLAKGMGKGAEALKGLFGKGDGQKKPKKEKGPERLFYDIR